MKEKRMSLNIEVQHLAAKALLLEFSHIKYAVLRGLEKETLSIDELTRLTNKFNRYSRVAHEGVEEKLVNQSVLEKKGLWDAKDAIQEAWDELDPEV